MKTIVPAILAGDKKDFERRLRLLLGSGIKFRKIQIDVMDGVFVPSKSIKIPDICRILSTYEKRKRKFSLEFHLMVKNPLKYVYDIYGIANTGDFIVFHAEAVDKKEAEVILNGIKNLNKKLKIGIAINPKTSVSEAKKKIDFRSLDEIIVMTVHPGFMGGKFIAGSLKKMPEIRKLNSKILIGVDGGINRRTINTAKKAGADFFVAGSTVFNKGRIKKNILEIGSVLRKNHSPQQTN